MQERIVDYLKTKHPVIEIFCSVFQEFDPVAIEQSVKVIGDSITKDRVLIGIPAHRISYNAMQKILEGFNFPEEHKERLEDYYRATTVIFALEVDGGKLNHRIYFEKNVTINDVEFYAKNSIKYANTITSVKWDFETPTNCNFTGYFLQVKNVDMYDIEFSIRNSGFNFIPKFVRTAKKNDKKVYLYNAVDENTDRKSFYVSIDDIYLRDLKTDILQLGNTRTYEKLEEFSDFEISNFGGGISKDGNKFYNIYFTMYKEDE